MGLSTSLSSVFAFFGAGKRAALGMSGAEEVLLTGVGWAVTAVWVEPRFAGKPPEEGGPVPASSAALGSERLTGALLDRLTHHVHILEMNGESYRLNQSRRRQTPTAN